MYGPSDMYGDMDQEDVDDFEGLQPNDSREIRPGGRFERGEVRSFTDDFEYELDQSPDEEWDGGEYGAPEVDEWEEDPVYLERERDWEDL